MNLTESVSLTASISKAAGVNLSESVSLTDSISKTPGVNLSESVSLTDSISKTPGVNLTESVSLTDSINYWAPTAWNKKVISINSTMVSGSSNLTHFPILVKLTDDTDLSTTSVGTGGVGIRFTSDGTELIDFEIDYYDGDSTDGTVHAWVKVPTLDHDDTTYIYIHYGQTTAQADAAATANNVWAESGESQEYVVVNHFMSALDTDNNTFEQIGSVAGEGDDFNTNNMDTATNQVTRKNWQSPRYERR